MVDRFHIVAVRIEQERRVVAGVVLAFARSAVVAAAGGKPRRMEARHDIVIRGLEARCTWLADGLSSPSASIHSSSKLTCFGLSLPTGIPSAPRTAL